jgi:glycerol-3-phosphate acyltransferase PlsY
MTALTAWMMTASAGEVALWVLLPAGAYLVGATPFAWIIARHRGVDLRTVGSGNIGATNVGRACGRTWGYLCFVLDVAKGLAPALAAGALLGSSGQLPTQTQQVIWLATGSAAVVGHVAPVWLGFRGGKGVATSLGVVLGVYPYFTFAGLAALAVWIAVVLASRYVSLASIVSAGAFLPLLVVFNGAGRIGRLWPMFAFAATIVALIIVRHRGNIARLLAGTENRIGSPKPKN